MNTKYSKNILFFFLANSLLQLGIGIFMVMYNLYIKALGYPEQINGLVISSTALAGAITLIPAGILSDSLGRRKMILSGLTLGSLFLFFRALVSSKELLVIFAFLSGIFMAFVQVSTAPLLAENSKGQKNVQVFSLNAAIMMFSGMFGSLLGGILTDIWQKFLLLNEVRSYQLTLLIGSSFVLFSLIPAFFIVEDRKNVEVKDYRNNILKNKSQISLMLNFTVATLLIGFGSGLVIPYLNLYFRDRFAATNSSIGLIISLGQLATATAILIGPYLVKKIGEVNAIVFLQLSSIPFLLLTGYTNNLIIASSSFLIRQALMNAGNPIQQSLIMGKVNDSLKGLANSLSAMVFSLGWALMGPISTTIVHSYGAYWGYVIVFTITAILYIISSIYFYFYFGKEKKKSSFTFRL